MIGILGRGDSSWFKPLNVQQEMARSQPRVEPWQMSRVTVTYISRECISISRSVTSRAQKLSCLTVMRLNALLSSLFRSLSSKFGQPTGSRTMSTRSNRSYQEAVEKLNTLQSNAAALDAVRASGGRLSEFAIPEMLEYLERIGYSVRTYVDRQSLSYHLKPTSAAKWPERP